tara:strand:+ start:473 stop:832 length:360 start_codon:yes stop_codon:yes gene_type:complete
MRKLLYILLFSVVGQTSVYASFPVSGYNNFRQIETIDEDTEDDKKLTKKQKIAWILVGLLTTFLGVTIALITQLISKKKKGQFKFALIGLAIYFAISIAVEYAITGELPFDLSETFILG